MDKKILHSVIKGAVQMKDEASKIKEIPSKIKYQASRIKRQTVKCANRIKAFITKHRWAIFRVILALVIIAIIASLVLNSIKGVSIYNQAVLINHTQSRILDGTYTNQQSLIGLGSTFFTVPKRKFLIYFGGSIPQQTQYKTGNINARVQQGTKVSIEARVQCQVSPTDLRLFLQNYGLNWHIYAIQKSKNVIIQNVASTRFYDLNNTLLTNAINAEFTGYRSTVSGYPFIFSVVSLKIKYPQNSFSINNTRGIQLLQKKSIQTQLLNHYDTLSSQVTNNITNLNAYATKIVIYLDIQGQLEGEIRRNELELAALRSNWLQGLQIGKSMLGNDTTQVRRYLWYYFQNLYNATYIAEYSKNL